MYVMNDAERRQSVDDASIFKMVRKPQEFYLKITCPVAPRSTPGKLGAATPGGGVAEDDRRKEPPRTTERSHSPDATHHNDAPASVSNNLNVVIDGHDASALVDTGADYSVLSGRLSRRLRKVTTPWDGPQIRTAGGHLITPVGRCTARVEIHGETCPVKFVVLQDCSRDVILGMDFLCEYGAVIDLGANRLTLRKPVSPPEEPKATSSAVRVLASHVNLPPRSSVFVPVGITEAFCGEVLLEGSLQLLLGRGIGVARGVAELQDGRTVVLVTNFRNEAQHLTKGAAVGHVEELRNSAEIAAITDESSPPQQDSLKGGVTPDDIPHQLRVTGELALAVVPGRAPLCLRCQRTGHIRKECRVPKCDVCRLFGHEGTQCVGTYAAAVGPVGGEEKSELLIDEADAEETVAGPDTGAAPSQRATAAPEGDTATSAVSVALGAGTASQAESPDVPSVEVPRPGVRAAGTCDGALPEQPGDASIEMAVTPELAAKRTRDGDGTDAAAATKEEPPAKAVPLWRRRAAVGPNIPEEDRRAAKPPP
ncbi:uncharacterized protein ISCGN_003679 [Ixodes scapularis]